MKTASRRIYFNEFWKLKGNIRDITSTSLLNQVAISNQISLKSNGTARLRRNLIVDQIGGLLNENEKGELGYIA